MGSITRSRPRQVEVTVEQQDDDAMALSFGVIRETISRANAVQELLPDWNPTVAIADMIRRYYGRDKVSGLRVTHQQKQASNVDVYRVTFLVNDEEFQI